MRSRTKRLPAAIAAAFIATLGLIPLAAGTALAAPITLSQVATGFHNPIGIDYHEPDNKLIISVNYPNGEPSNFALVAANGTQSPFSAVHGLDDELKLASVRSGPCQGGFATGEVFTGSGAPGVIVRVAADGSSIQNPWVTLLGESGLMRGSLFQDRYCSFGGDLVAVTTAGGVWRVSSAGAATKLAQINTHLEGVTTLPNDPAKYGPWAGTIVAGAENQTRFYTISTAGVVASFNLGIRPEDLDVINADENFYGVDYAGQKIWSAGASQFAGMVGDIAVAQESPGILWRVHWDAATSSFTKEELARVAQWEHVTFAPLTVVKFGVNPTPENATNPVGAPHTVTVLLVNAIGTPLPGIPVSFTVAGANGGATGTCAPPSCATDANGQVTFTYVGATAGQDTITACFDDQGTQRCATVRKTWVNPSVSINDVTVTEGDAGTVAATFTLTLSSPAGPAGVTVLASTANNTAVAPGDYQTRTNVPVSFAPGQSTQTFTVQVVGDVVDEPNETYFVNLSAPTNATIGDGQGVGTIIDDDRNGTFSCRATGLRTTGALGTTALAVANAPDAPCVDDAKTLLNANPSLGIVSVGARTLNAATDQTPNDLEAALAAAGDNGVATASVESVGVSTLITSVIQATLVSSTAKVECVAGPGGLTPTLTSSSSIGSLRILGANVNVNGSTTITLPLGLGSIDVNRVVTTPTSITRQALRINILGNEIVVAEARADFTGNPCTQ